MMNALKKIDSAQKPHQPKEGFKQTEVGMIPVDWVLVVLGEHIKLKNGFAFSSSHFGELGPIVITPGNFRLEGGLKLDTPKTIHYKGDYREDMVFEKGDLLMVMTDLTPGCNLLGKSGILKKDNEKILHNQRIGKIIITSSVVDKEYLCLYFNSTYFSDWMKSTATGSTVRHTSVSTINKTVIPLPPTLTEQRAIATALSDMDALIQAQEQLIAKKRAIKQGAMQDLLRPKEGWENYRLGELCYITTGAKDNKDKLEEGEYPFFVRSATVERINSYSFDGEAILIPGDGNVGEIYHYINGKFDFHQRVYKLSDFKKGFSAKYIYLLMQMYFKDHALKYTAKNTVDSLRMPIFMDFEITFPNFEEQTRIARILSDMDTEIEQLESQLAKYRQVKVGIMQELLTGKKRLV